MKSFKVGVVLLVSIVSLLYSCNEGHITGKYFLTDEMKSQIPYHGGETLFFTRNNVDTIMIVAMDRVNKVYEILDGINTNNYSIWEEESIYLNIDTIPNDTNSISLKMMTDFSGRNTFLEIVVYRGTLTNRFSYTLPLSKEYTPYIDSIYIMNRWIKDVFVHETALENTMYYSTQYGIVKIDFSDGSFWELERIEWAERE
ncbi:MAG: hypothetical protein K9G61_04585 [Bacteroidales bacterium]|nr:hypothetical protein [Bacteroidales bacterium]